MSKFQYDFSFNPISHTILGLVLNNSAVCEGISKLAKLVFDHIGIKSLIVTGKAKNPVFEGSSENHAWNIVKIDGNPYHLDITFDMTIMNKNNRYDYFLLCDEDIKKDHIITDKTPSCSIKENDYYTKNKMSINKIADLDNYIKDQLKLNKKTMTFKIMNEKFSESILKTILNKAQQHYTSFSQKSGSTSIEYNTSQMVFEITYN
jgi:transglutaminase/protease-like cytokinesis protein 3